MNPTWLVLGALLVLGSLVLIILGSRRSRQGGITIEDRLAEFGTLERPPTLEELELSLPFSERIALPVLRKLAGFVTRFTPTRSLESTQHKLDMAGNPYGWGPREFTGIRLLMALLFAGLGVLIFIFGKVGFLQRAVLFGVATGLGFYMPTVLVISKIRRRQKAIVKALPDALDLLTICVEAGLGFDAAMAKVAEKWENELSAAFTRVIQEVQLGKLRREALRDMSDRMEVPDVATFVAAIIQADQLGVSIARVLRIQSDQMRVRRRQRAEEMARAATLKILPPVAFFIFPSIFIVLLGPAVITIKNMQGLFGF
jgi:tight adherence protein C